MSETEPIPPTSSVTALRIPIIKKGEYDLCIFLSMLELHDATVVIGSAQLKFLRSLHLYGHVVATMIRGQPGLDELDFDDLYNKLKVCPTTPETVFLTQMNHMSFFAQQASMPTTHDDEEPDCQIDEMLWRIDNRWQVAMITAKDKEESRANGRNEKRIVAIEDSNSKALVATDNNEDIDWTKEFDAEPMYGLDDFDWSNKADDAPISLALMATNSEISRAFRVIRGFGIESSNSMESDISSGDETLTDSTYENFKREKAYKAVPPPTGTIIPPRANVSFTGIDELAIRNKVVNQEKTKSSQSAIDRNKVIIEDWVDSDDEETDVSESQKETAFNSENSETSFENRNLTKGDLIPSAVLKREWVDKYCLGPKMHNTVPSKRIANVISSTLDLDKQRPRKIEIYLVKKEVCWIPRSTPQNCQKECNDKSKQTWKPKGNYLDSVNRVNGSYTLKQFEGRSSRTMLSLTVDALKYEQRQVHVSDFKQFIGAYVAFEMTLKNVLSSSPKFKFVDEDLVILRAPRKNDDLQLGSKRNIIPSDGACQLQKISNKLGLKANLVRGLPSDIQA
ncbi:hypothetical protein Tco_1101880 [Tanacetum coccineum]